jgi:NDP-sugar pyrophosphorylase family protein
MKAVILAAGRGTRLTPYSDILPKPLMPIETDKNSAFKSIIEKLIYQISLADIKEIIIVVNYKADLIINYLGDGSRMGVKLAYVFQEKLDGNAGAYYRARHLVSGSPVLITDCDNFINDDSLFISMRKEHEEKNQDLTVAVCRVNNIKKYAIIKTDAGGKPVDIFEKPDDEKTWGNLAKSGMMMLSAALAAKDKSISLTASGEYTTTEIVRHAVKEKLPTGLFNIEKGFTDIGTWEEYIPVLKKMLEKNQ